MQSKLHCLGVLSSEVRGLLINTKDLPADTPVRGHPVRGQGCPRTCRASWRVPQLFGGELQKLNMFTKKLSSSEVSRMYKAGRCSDTVEKTFSRNLKWEDIMKTTRHGNVKTLDTCCGERQQFRRRSWLK